MTKKIFHRLLLLITIGLLSCNEDLLDKLPKDSLTEEIVWEDAGAAEQFLNGIYGRMISGFEREGSWGYGISLLDAAIDDGDNAFYTSTDDIARSTFGPSNSPMPNQWAYYYGLVRKTNLALANLDRITGNDEVKQRLKGEAYFLRAYLYHELLRFYGLNTSGAGPTGVPIIDQPLASDDDFQIPRSSYSECVDFIVNDLDEAALLLPGFDAATPGRASVGAAIALKSRVLLYAGEWTEAAGAASEVMNLSPGYSLYPDYRTLFITKNNPEIIFAKKFVNPTKVHGNDIGWSPGFDVTHTVSGGAYAGWGGTCPTQNLVDAFEMTDGKPYDESPLYDPANPYSNRDPRFYAIVLYNGSAFRGSVVETFDGGLNTAAGGAQDATKTGYYIRKFHDENNILFSTDADGDWIFIRYAEVLLNYAEARNEAVGPDESVYEAVNAIRQRPGVELPALPTGLSQDAMRERIYHERRIELSFEEHRYFDLRRWGLAQTVLNEPIYGMQIIKSGSNFTYNRFVVEPRTFLSKVAVLPIPQDEITKNPACVQIGGWQ